MYICIYTYFMDSFFFFYIDHMLKWPSLLVQLVKNLPAMQETLVQRDRLPTPEFLGFPGGSAGKESICNEGDLGSIPGLERSPGERKGYALQYSGLENFMDLYSPWGRKELDKTERLLLSYVEVIIDYVFG